MSRWEVFKQDAPGKPHQAVGSVHAADPEHALVIAAHVFARRPAAHSLWVAPEDAVYSRTAQELAAPATDANSAVTVPPEAAAAGEDAFEVFRKPSHKRSMTFVDHVGTFRAATPAQALARAREAVAGDGEALAWWVVPATALTASAPEDAPSWFEPAKDKTYKQQSQYASGPTAPTKRGS